MLTAMVEGTTDPEVLAELARGRLRVKIPALKEAMAGRFGPHHRLIVGTILSKLEFLEEVISHLSDVKAGRKLEHRPLENSSTRTGC
jgi:transposase